MDENIVILVSNVWHVYMYMYMKKTVMVGPDKPVIPGEQQLQVLIGRGYTIPLIHKVNHNACGSATSQLRTFISHFISTNTSLSSYTLSAHE